MWQNKIRILIVEDNSNDLHLIRNALETKGFKTLIAKRDHQALNFINHYSIHAILIDIMLPGKDGVSLAQEIQKTTKFKGPLFLMSGIFKGSEFMQNAIKKTEAKNCFLKPIESEKLIGELESHLSNVNVDIPAKSDFPSLFTREFSSKEKKLRALKHSRRILGFDLLSVLSALIDTNMSGHINIFCSKGMFGFTIHQGHIDVLPSTNTIEELKKYILEKKYLSEKEMQDLKTKSNYEFIKTILDLQFLSPHVLIEIIGQEIKKNLQTLIKENSLLLNFVPDSILNKNKKSTHLKKIAFARMIHDLIKEDLPLEKIKEFYADLMEHPIHRRPEFGRKNIYFTLPLIKYNNFILNLLNKRPSLTEIIKEEEEVKEQDIFRPLHFMLLFQLIIFGSKKKIQNISHFRTKIKTIWKKIQNKNPFQIFEQLGVESSNSLYSIEKHYQNYRDSYHPGLLPINSPESIKKISHNCLAEVTEAYQILTDEKKRAEIQKKILEEEKEKRQELNHLIQTIEPLFKSNKMKEALLEIKNSKLLSSSEEVSLYQAWAEIKSETDKSKLLEIASDWQKELIVFSSAIKQTSLFHFVLGLCHKSKEEFSEARASFSKTLEINENFKTASLELNNLPLTFKRSSAPKKEEKVQKTEKSSDIFHMITHLFKKSNE